MNRYRLPALLLALGVVVFVSCYPPPFMLFPGYPLELSASRVLKDKVTDESVIRGYVLINEAVENPYGSWEIRNGAFDFAEIDTMHDTVFGSSYTTHCIKDFCFNAASDNFHLAVFAGPHGDTRQYEVANQDFWGPAQSGLIKQDNGKYRAIVSGKNLSWNSIEVFQSGAITKDDPASYDKAFSNFKHLYSIPSLAGQEQVGAFDGAMKYSTAFSKDGNDIVNFYQTESGGIYEHWWQDGSVLHNERIASDPIDGQFDDSIAGFSNTVGTAWLIRKTFDSSLNMEAVYQWGDRKSVEVAKLPQTDQFQSFAGGENPRGLINFFYSSRNEIPGIGNRIGGGALNLFTFNLLNTTNLELPTGVDHLGAKAYTPIRPRDTLDLGGLVGFAGVLGSALFFKSFEDQMDVMFCAADFGDGVRFDGKTALLKDQRFGIKVGYSEPNDSGQPQERAAALPAQVMQLSDDTAAWFFFGPDNIELVTKVIDGCKSSGHYWVFAGGLTNLGVEIEVTNYMNGKVKSYLSKAGTAFQPLQDGKAFACKKKSGKSDPPLWTPAPIVEYDHSAVRAMSASFDGPRRGPWWAPPLPLDLQTRALPTELADIEPLAVSSKPSTPSEASTLAARGAVCKPSSQRLCLLDGQFRAKANFKTSKGAEGKAQTQRLSDDSGYMTFFDLANVELLVKMIDACNKFGHFWVFSGGLTNVEVELEITNMATGKSETYKNPLGTKYKPVQDVKTFPCT